MKWAEHVVCLGEIRNVYKISVGKPEGRRPLEKRRCRWEDNIKRDSKETG
jgi:hypothetical protein